MSQSLGNALGYQLSSREATWEEKCYAKMWVDGPLRFSTFLMYRL